MAKVSEVFGSKSWKASDLVGGPMVLTIKGVKPYKFDDGSKLVVSFEESDKDLISNKTNSSSIAKSYGDDTDNWIGKRIQLYLSETEFKGDIVDCVRVQGPRSKAAPPPPPDFDDQPDDRGDPGPDDDYYNDPGPDDEYVDERQ